MELAREAVLFALSDLRSGAPSHGFNRLFKNSPRSEVEATLQQVAAGSIRDDHHRHNAFPSIVCANSRTRVQYNLPPVWIKDCQGESKQIYYAFFAQPTAYIVLCELFFTMPLIPPKMNQPPKPLVCPVWLPDRQKVSAIDEDGTHTCLYQAFALIHEAVHFYRVGSLNREVAPVEQYTWPGMLGLKPRYQLENPKNYEAYVASMLCLRLSALPPWDVAFS